LTPGAARGARRLLAFACLVLATAAGAEQPAMERSLERIRHEWVVATFDLAPERRGAALETLSDMAHQLAQRFPGEPQARAWEGIVLASLAESRGPVMGYFVARDARVLLHAVEREEPAALDGAGYAALGLLYATAPGWPLSFGDHALARAYFEKAVETTPGGMEAHYFYGGFLLREGEYGPATRHLRLALTGGLRADPLEPGLHHRGEVRRVLARAEHRP